MGCLQITTPRGNAGPALHCCCAVARAGGPGGPSASVCLGADLQNRDGEISHDSRGMLMMVIMIMVVMMVVMSDGDEW